MLEGKGLIPPPADVVAMWNDYQALIETRMVRDHLGLSATEWDEQPARFTDWAVEFHRLELRRRNG